MVVLLHRVRTALSSVVDQSTSKTTSSKSDVSIPNELSSLIPLSSPATTSSLSCCSLTWEQFSDFIEVLDDGTSIETARALFKRMVEIQQTGEPPSVLLKKNLKNLELTESMNNKKPKPTTHTSLQLLPNGGGAGGRVLLPSLLVSPSKDTEDPDSDSQNEQHSKPFLFPSSSGEEDLILSKANKTQLSKVAHKTATTANAKQGGRAPAVPAPTVRADTIIGYYEAKKAKHDAQMHFLERNPPRRLLPVSISSQQQQQQQGATPASSSSASAPAVFVMPTYNSGADDDCASPSTVFYCDTSTTSAVFDSASDLPPMSLAPRNSTVQKSALESRRLGALTSLGSNSALKKRPPQPLSSSQTLTPAMAVTTPPGSRICPSEIDSPEAGEDGSDNDFNSVLRQLKNVIEKGCQDHEEWDNLRYRGITQYALGVLKYALENPEAEIEECKSGSRVDDDGTGGSGSMRSHSLHAFASALALKHIATGASSLWQLSASALFVDISGYSKVAAAMGDRGLHTFSSVVNAYLEIIVEHIGSYGGDVVKFAGDAIIALWYSDVPPRNTRAAISCAFSLLKNCGSYVIPEVPTDTQPTGGGPASSTTTSPERKSPHGGAASELTFGLHIGASAGTIVSHVFTPRASSLDATTPTHFHFITGDPVSEVSIACDAAKRDEIVIDSAGLESMRCAADDDFASFLSTAMVSETSVVKPAVSSSRRASLSSPRAPPSPLEIKDFSKDYIDVEPIIDRVGLYKVIGLAPGQQELALDIPDKTSLTPYAKNVIPPRVLQRVASLEGDVNPLYLAEMRDLVVLFISSSTDKEKNSDEQIWFDEVFAVLTGESCSIVQIINDDKGVHVVAAFNLYIMHDDAADLAISLCTTLRTKHLDCHIGVAIGSVLCGFLGARHACQWDITGPACVRACRLMQYAIAHHLDVVFDESIFKEASNRSNLNRLKPITVKGSPVPVEIFSLRRAQGARSTSSTTALGEVPRMDFVNLCLDVHKEPAEQIVGILEQRKKLPSWASLAAEDQSFVASDTNSNVEDSTTLSRTPSNVVSVRRTRRYPTMIILVGAPGTGKYSLCHVALQRANTGLVPVVHSAGHDRRNVELDVLNTFALWLRFTFRHNTEVVKLSRLVQETLRKNQMHTAFKLGVEMIETAMLQENFRCALIIRHGQFLDSQSIVFLRNLSERYVSAADMAIFVTCSPQYNNRAPHEAFLARWGTIALDLCEISAKETASLTEFVLDKTPCAASLHEFIVAKTGRFVESVVELTQYLRRKNLLTFQGGVLSITPGQRNDVQATPWDIISTKIKRKCIHQLDYLPLYLITMAKIICAITEQPGISAFFYSVNRVCEIMLGQQLRIRDVELLQSLFILRMCEHKCTAHTGNGELDAAVFFVPAMRDVCHTLLMSQQRRQINIICANAYVDTHPMNHPMQYLVRARHYLFAQDSASFTEDFFTGWTMICDMFYTPDDHVKRHEQQLLYVTWALKCPTFTDDKISKLKSSHEARRAFQEIHKLNRVHWGSRTPRVGDLVYDFLWFSKLSAAYPFLPLELGPTRGKLQTLLFHLLRLDEMMESSERTRGLQSVRSHETKGELERQYMMCVAEQQKVRTALILYIESVRHLALDHGVSEDLTDTALRPVEQLFDRELVELDDEDDELELYRKHYTKLEEADFTNTTTTTTLQLRQQQRFSVTEGSSRTTPLVSIETVIWINKVISRHVREDLLAGKDAIMPSFVHTFLSVDAADVDVDEDEDEVDTDELSVACRKFSAASRKLTGLRTSCGSSFSFDGETLSAAMLERQTTGGFQQAVLSLFSMLHVDDVDDGVATPRIRELKSTLHDALSVMYNCLLLPASDQTNTQIGFVVFLCLWCEDVCRLFENDILKLKAEKMTIKRKDDDYDDEELSGNEELHVLEQHKEGEGKE